MDVEMDVETDVDSNVENDVEIDVETYVGKQLFGKGQFDGAAANDAEAW
jgi:hypothetical protein